MSISRLGQNRITGVAGAVAQDYALISVKGKQIVKAAKIAVYNSHAAQTLTFYVGIRRHGKFHRFHYKATLAAKTIEPIDFSLYLHSGDELIINAIASGAATTFEVCFQLLDVE